MSASVKIEGIAKSYKKGVPVLNPLDLEIRAGELFFLLGPSGCGKSTLLRMIAGLLEPTAGKIYFDEEDITTLPPEKRQAAMVFQNYALWPHLSVFENVAFGLRAAHVSGSGIRQKVTDALKLVRMSEFADRRIPSLSGGQQQRVALARAIAVSPRVLLLDEPLSNLDAKLRDEMRSEIGRICKERSLTAVYVTHDRREALSLGDRIALLDKGVIQQVGTPVELYRHPRNRFAAAFLGEVNFIKGSVQKGILKTAFGEFHSDRTLSDKKECTLLLRPEIFTIEHGSKAEGANCFAAKYISGTFLGAYSELKFQTADGTYLEVTAPAFEQLNIGDTVTLRIHPDDIAVLED